MKSAMSIVAPIIAVALLVAGLARAHADARLCILRGPGGEARYDERFVQWSERLVAAMTSQGTLDPATVFVAPTDAAAPPLTRELLESTLADFGASLQPDDVAVVVLIGHGSVQQEPRFILSGPDIGASDLAALLEGLPARRQVVIHGASASGAFLEALSRPDRVVVTSTRGGEQPNAPEFLEHFIQVLETGRGDQNRDGRLTLDEWCDGAAESTGQWFVQQDFVATETAMIDDNGDARGTTLPRDGADDAGDGALASTLIFREQPGMAEADSAALAAYHEALAAVETWKAERVAHDETAYWNRLEELLLQAARLNPVLTTPPAPAENLVPGPE